MSYIIKFTPEAEETFDALSEQLANRWGLEYVYQFEDRVIKALNIIADTPFLYPIILNCYYPTFLANYTNKLH